MTDDYRSQRIEDALEKLADISSDLNKVIAVHEQRINQNERQMDTIEEIIEKRREEADIKLQNVYDTIRSEDKNIVEQLNKMREENAIQYVNLTDKISKMEKMMWIYVGGFSVVSFIIAYGQPIFKILSAAPK